MKKILSTTHTERRRGHTSQTSGPNRAQPESAHDDDDGGGNGRDARESPRADRRPRAAGGRRQAGRVQIRGWPGHPEAATAGRPPVTTAAAAHDGRRRRRRWEAQGWSGSTLATKSESTAIFHRLLPYEKAFFILKKSIVNPKQFSFEKSIQSKTNNMRCNRLKWDSFASSCKV